MNVLHYAGINLISTLICSGAYYIIVFNVPYFYQRLDLSIVCGLAIVFNAINVDWFYQGLEEYGYITLRNLIIKLVSLVAVFLFVKTIDDYIVYAEHTNTTKQLEHYILKGGVYGTMEGKVAIEQSSKGGKFQYAFSRLIVPYELLKINYPIIESHKWLTPFMEVKRWIRLLFSGRFSYAVKELNCNNNVSRKTVVEMREFLKNVGL